MKDDEGGSAAIDWKADRQCVYCLERRALLDSLSCAECMRGIKAAIDPAMLSNAWRWAAPPLRPGETISVRYVRIPFWKRFARWLHDAWLRWRP